MSRRGQLGLVAFLALTLAAAVEPAPGADLEYLSTLRLPTRGDRLQYPTSVVTDSATGEVFVCDPRRDRILIFDREGLLEFEISGGNDFRSPSDVAIDADGFLLVTAYHENRQTVLELDFDGLVLGEVAPRGLPDWVERTYFVSVALSGDGDRVFVLDQRNLHIWITDRAGQLLGSIDLAAGLTADQREEASVSHVDVFDDQVLVALPRVGIVRAYDLEGKLLRTTGEFGSGSCELLFPVTTAMDAKGEYLVLDRHRMVVSIWDPSTNSCVGDHFGFGFAPGYLYFPTDLALDRNGRVYITQPWEGRVQVYRWSDPAAGRSE